MKKVLVTGGSGFIGIHLIERLKSLNYMVLNIDIKPPIDKLNLELWCNTSVIDSTTFKKKVLDFAPDYIVHLSAVTTQNSNTIEDFKVNIDGTQNLINIANGLTNLKKIIFTSTQYVNSPGHPFSDNSLKLLPYGLYGKSKLIGEELVRKEYINHNWIIIRPTTIWGPWHTILAKGLWRQILKRRYFHPSGDTTMKAYGYVKNTAWQIVKLLEEENKLTDEQIFYLADDNLSQKKWVESFVNQLTGRQLMQVPKVFLFIMSEFGEILVKFGFSFPLYRSRYRNLITSNPSPLDKTLKILGPSPVDLKDAIEETCTWLHEMDLMNNLENNADI